MDRLISELHPPDKLFSLILARIRHERHREARFRLVAFGTVTCISLLLLVPAVQYAMNEFYTSGFYEYATLFIDSLTNGYAKEVLYSLADSLPSLSLLILACIGSAFVWSLRRTNENARIVFGRTVTA